MGSIKGPELMLLYGLSLTLADNNDDETIIYKNSQKLPLHHDPDTNHLSHTTIDYQWKNLSSSTKFLAWENPKQTDSLTLMLFGGETFAIYFGFKSCRAESEFKLILIKMAPIWNKTWHAIFDESGVHTHEKCIFSIFQLHPSAFYVWKASIICIVSIGRQFIFNFFFSICKSNCIFMPKQTWHNKK